MMASLRSLPAGSATPSGRIDDFHVEQAAGCLPEQHRDKAGFWIAHYLETHVRAVDERRGHNPTIRGEASAILEAVATLKLAMDAAGAETVAIMGIAHGKNVSPDLGGGAVEAAEKFEINFQDCRDYLQAIERAAGRVTTELPSQNKSESMHELVERLAKIWRNTTGTRPTTNRNRQNLRESHGFDAFLECACNALPVAGNYLYGLEAAVQSVVEHWKHCHK